jgi:hypothetical protein
VRTARITGKNLPLASLLLWKANAPSPSLACRYNEATDETSWDRPEGVADTEWAEARHVESDDIYYVNTKTQETSWDKPAELQ